MLKDTALIPDPVLAREVQMCVYTDTVYGCIVDTVKHSIGHEYEYLLQVFLFYNPYLICCWIIS